MSKRRILFYSHDTFGLGHIRRTQKIANRLADEDTSVIILCSSPKTSDFASQKGVEYIKLPGFTKLQTGDYVSRNLNLELMDFVEIRSKLIEATVDCFKPDVLVVDKEPLGVKAELLPALKYIQNYLPHCQKICGLRDILDEPAKIKKEWTRRNSYYALKNYYDHVLVYGDQNIYDLSNEYKLDADLAKKFNYMGYLFESGEDIVPQPTVSTLLNFPKNHKELPLVLFTLGGGEDGQDFLKVYTEALLELPHNPAFKTLVITGPFLPQAEYEMIEKKLASKSHIKMTRFVPNFRNLIQKSQLVISMGGYNTFCENLSHQQKPLILPRIKPRKEQLIRAEIFKDLGLCDYIHPDNLNPKEILTKIEQMLASKESPPMNFEHEGLSKTVHFIDKLTRSH